LSNYRSIENNFVNLSNQKALAESSLMPRVENLETFGVSLSTNYSFRSVSSNFQ